MKHDGVARSEHGIEEHGITNANMVWWNLPTTTLVEHAIRREEGHLAHLGPLVVRTGEFTGRSPRDKFIVREPSSEKHVAWGDVNRAFDEAHYDGLRARMLSYLQGRDLYVQDCYVGADPEYRLPIRVITELAWHNVFARNMFLREPDRRKLERHVPQFAVIDAPGFEAHPDTDGTRSDVFVILNFGRREALIGGTGYAGEMKKSMLTVMSYTLPLQRILPMHCSANYGRNEDDVALFFGLSGTGKTTLSADPQRTLIGDDEHGWSDRGVFNFEGGCYAKVIRLSAEGEPEIYETTRRFGTILENVAMDMVTRRLDLDSDEYTENTRASYPISYIPNASPTGVGGHPKVVIMLAADAFGVLPPIARLSPAQAMYHFLSGYTAKVAGTERGITEPQATFSTCFGAPFMVMNPSIYANLLRDKINKHDVPVWLINTGWTGGTYGEGKRVKLIYTRAMVHAALNGSLQNVPMTEDPVFGIQVPERCPDVPKEVLQPRGTWRDAGAYDAQARKLAKMFDENFKTFAAGVAPEVRTAGPRT